mgnify:CR=1 FL=1
MGKKKPTVKELAKVINLIIQDMEIARKRILNLEEVLGEYIVYEKNDKKFQKHMKKKIKEYEEKQIKENVKDGVKDSVRDDKQQVVSSSKGCY